MNDEQEPVPGQTSSSGRGYSPHQASRITPTRSLFSPGAAGLEYNSFGARSVDPARPRRGPRVALGGCGSTPRGVPLVESADERETRKGQEDSGFRPGQRAKP